VTFKGLNFTADNSSVGDLLFTCHFSVHQSVYNTNPKWSTKYVNSAKVQGVFNFILNGQGHT